MSQHKLIIAEKPSLARNIVAAIGAGKFKKTNNYYESSDYIVTFAFGHLFSLKDLEEYSSNYDPEQKIPWTLDGLPFCPDPFLFSHKKDLKTGKLDLGSKRQFQEISKLCARKDVDSIIHAGDADREGEVIIRIILAEAGNQKPVMRLWMPDQTPETIRAELHALKMDSSYDNLANEGYARTYIDWLYGINLTRYATLKSGCLLRVGRVIVPIVKAIYDRDMEIRNFVPHKYLGLVSKESTNGKIIELTSKRFFELSEQNDATTLADTYNKAGARVKSIDKKNAVIQPGKLYSLSKLQGVLGKRFKMAPKESLAIVQSLYEAGYISYPRTNSEYLATTQRDSINAIISKLAEQGYKVCSKDKKRTIYDDSKIESHSALTPTNKLAKKPDLKEDEWRVYTTILNRFLAVFCSEDCLVDRTTIEIQVGDLETFKLKGDVFISKGWLQYDDNGKEDKILPQLFVGEEVNISFKPVDRESKPPIHYTVDSLNKYLKNPFRKELASNERGLSEDKEDDLSDIVSDNEVINDEEEYNAMFEGVELGTEATRTGIIDTAIRSKYISLKNNVYTIRPDGEFLIESLSMLQIDMGKERTAKLGRVLKSVYRGEVSVSQSVSQAFEEIKSYFSLGENVQINRAAPPKDAMGESLGSCPKCGGQIFEKSALFGCANQDCSFAIWKDNKLMKSIGKKLNSGMVKSLLRQNKVLLKNCKSAKSGNTFDCFLIPDFSDKYASFRLEYPNAEEVSLGFCPKCGSPVIEKEKLFGCSNNACRFAIWKDDRFFDGIGRKPTAAIVKQLLSKGVVKLKNCTSKKTRKSFDCCIYASFEGSWPKYEIQFINRAD